MVALLAARALRYLITPHGDLKLSAAALALLRQLFSLPLMGI